MPITMADPPLTTLALDPDALLANLFRVHHGPLVRTATLLLDDRHHRTEGAPLGRPGHRPDVVPRTGRERAVRERARDVRPLVTGLCDRIACSTSSSPRATPASSIPTQPWSRPTLAQNDLR